MRYTPMETLNRIVNEEHKKYEIMKKQVEKLKGANYEQSM